MTFGFKINLSITEWEKETVLQETSGALDKKKKDQFKILNLDFL